MLVCKEDTRGDWYLQDILVNRNWLMTGARQGAAFSAP